MIRLTLGMLVPGADPLGSRYPALPRGSHSALDDVVLSISRSQAVDETSVRIALQRVASTEDEQMRLAREWEGVLPSRAFPDLDALADDLLTGRPADWVRTNATSSRGRSRTATCSLRTTPLPAPGPPARDWGPLFEQRSLSLRNARHTNLLLGLSTAAECGPPGVR